MKDWLVSLLIILFLTFPSYAKVTCFLPNCHNRSQIIKGKAHAPVSSGECLKCHLPHVSKYKALLKERYEVLCFSCHKEIKEDLSKALYVHAPVAKKSCLRCHEAHSSVYNGLLKNTQKQVCISCHKNVLKKFKYLHEPFRKGKCLDCHMPHFSNNDYLICKKGNTLCFSCHKKDKLFVQKHKVKNFYNIENIECLSCHNPHGSSKKALLREVNHIPYQKGNCKVCHNAKEMDTKLCLSCHSNILKTFRYFHNHLLGGYKKNVCLICHSPHVADTKALLRDKPAHLCESCHNNVKIQRNKSLYVHPHEEECMNCHVGHGSNHPAMLRGDGNSVCIRCHEAQVKISHPVGEKVRDPRNGQPITCITCHEPMGANFKYNLRLSGEAALCLECHKNY